MLLDLQLKHPNVLAFRDSAEVQEKGQTVIYLVTQAVKPLKVVLEELNLSGQHRCACITLALILGTAEPDCFTSAETSIWPWASCT